MNRWYHRLFNAVDGLLALAAGVRGEFQRIEEAFDALELEVDARTLPYIPGAPGNPRDILRTNLAGTAAEWVPQGRLPLISVTASRDVAPTDAGALLLASSATPLTLTLPNNSVTAIDVETTFVVVQAGAGKVSFAGASGVVLRAADSLYGSRAQYSQITCIKIATNEWLIGGDRG